MAILTPYVTFRGNCREAMIFYKDSFGGELTFQTVGETPSDIRYPPGTEDQIMHATLIIGDIIIMASDMISRAGFTLGTNISLSLTCDSLEQIERIFFSLSMGGNIKDQLSRRPWGAFFGVITDRFGITWMLSYDAGYT
ncbi:VOC family protein [Pedobacter ginsengisoli]|uniref:VOC family protein n=1 Tax=Pedobacter ginsengisoli TaxID=363852 RepID=UPI00254AE7D4|nr:VOC family protein [Pedobacter ginsengisoli]